MSNLAHPLPEARSLGSGDVEAKKRQQGPNRWSFKNTGDKSLFWAWCRKSVLPKLQTLLPPRPDRQLYSSARVINVSS